MPLEILFWFLFFIFNFIQFVFNYGIQYEIANVFPISLKKIKKREYGVFVSNNSDFFRLSIDVSLMILLYRFHLLNSGYMIFAGIYCFFFLFNCYHYAFRYIYKSKPILANDITLLRDGLAILYNESKLKLALFGFIILFVLVSLFLTFEEFLRFSRTLSVNSITIIISILLGSYFIAGILRMGFYHTQDDTYPRYILFVYRIIVHFIQGRRLAVYNNKVRDLIGQHQIYGFNSSLKKQPNVYLIFMESYGSILLRDNFIKDKFKEKIVEFDTSIRKNEWHIKSNLSKSISLRGPSWLAYSSFLYGLKIDSHFLYESLMKNRTFHNNDSLLTYLKTNGYVNFNLNPTKSNETLKVPMEDLTRFYHVDNWILRRDMEYVGIEYGFGDFPPDQYSLNYAYEHFLKHCKTPFSLFYLTKNSHSPFECPDWIPEDWRTLNKFNGGINYTGGFLKRPNLYSYFNVISYELDVIRDFIQRNGDENDIFLLIGDHQPHYISDKEKHGIETIVHVISKDQSFVDGFERYGFRDSLYDKIKPVTHEGLHSAFLRELIRNYSDQKVLPEYMPYGLQF